MPTPHRRAISACSRRNIAAMNAGAAPDSVARLERPSPQQDRIQRHRLLKEPPLRGVDARDIPLIGRARGAWCTGSHGDDLSRMPIGGPEPGLGRARRASDPIRWHPMPDRGSEPVLGQAITWACPGSDLDSNPTRPPNTVLARSATPPSAAPAQDTSGHPTGARGHGARARPRWPGASPRLAAARAPGP